MNTELQEHWSKKLESMTVEEIVELYKEIEKTAQERHINLDDPKSVGEIIDKENPSYWESTDTDEIHLVVDLIKALSEELNFTNELGDNENGK